MGNELKIWMNGCLGEIEVTFPRGYQKYPAGDYPTDKDYHCIDKAIKLYKALEVKDD